MKAAYPVLNNDGTLVKETHVHDVRTPRESVDITLYSPSNKSAMTKFGSYDFDAAKIKIKMNQES